MWGSYKRGELVAWAAGIFEGEGSITQCDRRLTLNVTNTDEWLIRQFHRVVRVGRVYGPYTSGHKDGFRRKPFWRWVAMGDAADDVLELLEPWLSDRRLMQAEQISTGSKT